MRYETERQLEDYLVSNIEQIIPGGIVIKRQFHVPNGIIDILAYTDDGTLHVVELKKGNINKEAIMQVLRYRSDVRRVLDLILSEIKLPEHDPYVSFNVDMTLVGSGVTAADLAVCEDIGINVATYELAPKFNTWATNENYLKAFSPAVSHKSLDEFKLCIKGWLDKWSPSLREIAELNELSELSEIDREANNA